MADRTVPRDRFPYAERAAAVEVAQKSVHDAVGAVKRRNDPNDPATAAWDVAVNQFYAAVDAAYPPGFWDACDRLREGDPAGLEMAIEFLEADPWFFRSGYIKGKLLRMIKRLPLTPEQAQRLRQVVLAIVDRRAGQEFREYCRLASRLDGDELLVGLERRLDHSDAGIRRRALWMLQSLDLDKAG